MTAMLAPFRFHQAPEYVLNKDQLAVLQAFMDTFVAPLTAKEQDKLVAKLSPTVAEADVRALSAVKGTDLDSDALLHRYINRLIAPPKRKEFSWLLTLLSTRAGTFALTGHTKPFIQLTRKEREKTVLGWKDSMVPQIRLIYKTFYSIVCHALYGASSSTPLLRPMQYHSPDINHAALGTQEDVPARPRLPMLSRDEVLQAKTLQFDCIVVGSGAGGGVVAAELAKAGKSVLVVDKGTYYHHSEFESRESTAFANLYELGGFFPTMEGSLTVLAGSTFGGGTTVNWSACLKPQHFVREEWAKQGLSHFTSPKFSHHLDRVFERIGASTDGIQHNGSNQVLVDGCKALGFPIADIHQNTDGRAHSCAYCFTGCKAGIKNSTTHSWLCDAAQHGARFLDRTKVLRVLVEKGKAVGVEALVHDNDHKVVIHADQVVVSAGSLQTPGVLLRSGLTNKHIGQHLRLHPCSIAMGYFDKPIETYRGSIMTAVSTVAENVDHEGYGAKLEVPCLHPGAYSCVVPWRGAAEHKDLMLRYRHCSPILILSRDRDSRGSVKYDDEDNLTTSYVLSKHDKKSIMSGIVRALMVLCAAGARELHTGQYGVAPFRFGPEETPSTNHPRFERWLQAVAQYGLPPNGAGLFCAHQMGTCRMGVSPNVSVTKPTGESWEVKDLFVADASLFPTASGVNPMVTVEALALHVAESMQREQTVAKL